MSLQVHRLEGCRPTPLAHYLKALGVLRLIGEQADELARGFWRDDVFHLVTALDCADMEEFFLERYSPTPIVGPWNGGSGFSEGDSIEGRESIRTNISPRFAGFRETIETILTWPELPKMGLSIDALCKLVCESAARKVGKQREAELEAVEEVMSALEAVGDAQSRKQIARSSIEQLKGRTGLSRAEDALRRKILKAAGKVRTKANSAQRTEAKPELPFKARRLLSDEVVRWLDATLILGSEGKLAYPPLLGSGGNEGRLDYTNAFCTALKTAIADADPMSGEWLRTALWSARCAALDGPATGQFNPGSAGGFNQGVGFQADANTNPWDHVLALEGAVVWASSATRVGRFERQANLSSPFTVRLKSVGYSSASAKDDEAARAEIWAPLWGQPVGYRELASFIGESRAQIGRRSKRMKAVLSATDFSEAARSYGIARGVTEFVRYGLLKRRGDSYLALPTGRFSVEARPEVDLVRGLDPLLNDVDVLIRTFGEQDPPQRLSALRRQIDSAIFQALARPTSHSMQAVLLALGEMEQYLAQRDRSKKPALRRPLLGLSPRWILAADGGELELRVAASLASIMDCEGKVGPLRANLTSIDPARPWEWSEGHGQVCWMGQSVPRRLVSALRVRMMDAHRLGCSEKPLKARIGLHPFDIAAFIDGDLDDAKTEKLLFGASLIDWRSKGQPETIVSEVRKRWSSHVDAAGILPQYALIKLLFWPGKVQADEHDEDGVTIATELSVLPLLLAKRSDDACEVARRRLYASGFDPVGIRCLRRTSFDPTRLAASLLIPCRYSSLSRLTEIALVAKPQAAEQTQEGEE